MRRGAEWLRLSRKGIYIGELLAIKDVCLWLSRQALEKLRLHLVVRSVSGFNLVSDVLRKYVDDSDVDRYKLSQDVDVAYLDVL